MIEMGSPIDGVLTRIANMMQQANTKVDAEIDLIRNQAADPRTGMRLLVAALQDLAGEAGYQAERLDKLLAEYDQRHG